MSSFAYDYVDDKEADKLIDDLSRDNRVGKQNFMLTQTPTEGEWPSGGTYFEFEGVLTTANNYRFSFRINPPDHPDVIATEAAAGKKMAMTRNLKTWKALKKMGKMPLDLKEGDSLAIITYREKPKAGADVGFLRMSEITGPGSDEAKRDENMPGF